MGIKKKKNAEEKYAGDGYYNNLIRYEQANYK